MSKAAALPRKLAKEQRRYRESLASSISNKQRQFREQQQQRAQSVSQLCPFKTTMTQALSSRGQTPAPVTGLGKTWERRKVSQEWRTGTGSGRVSPQPVTPTTNSLVGAFPVVEPRTPLIVVEDKHPYAVAV